MNITHRNYHSSWRRLLTATFALWACISALPWASALQGEGAGTPFDCEDAPLVVDVEFDSDTVGAESGHSSLVHSSTTDWTVVEDGGTKYYESTASQTNLKVEFPSTITLANGEALRVKVDYQYMSPPTDPGTQPFNFLRFGAYHDQGTLDYGDDVGYLADVSYWQQDTDPFSDQDR